MIAKLHYITQDLKGGLDHIHQAKEALECGVKWVQIRMKHHDDEDLVEAGKEIVKSCRKHKAVCIVNDRPDIAKIIGADGVHLGKNDISIPEARKILGSKAIIGATANTLEDILNLPLDQVNYIGLGPFRFTSTKHNLSPVLGLEGYQDILTHMHEQGIKIPVIAIGGILPTDVDGLLETGVHGIAVASLINLALDKEQVITKLIESLGNE